MMLNRIDPFAYCGMRQHSRKRPPDAKIKQFVFGSYIELVRYILILNQKHINRLKYYLYQQMLKHRCNLKRFLII